MPIIEPHVTIEELRQSDAAYAVWLDSIVWDFALEVHGATKTIGLEGCIETIEMMLNAGLLRFAVYPSDKSGHVEVRAMRYDPEIDAYTIGGEIV